PRGEGMGGIHRRHPPPALGASQEHRVRALGSPRAAKDPADQRAAPRDRHGGPPLAPQRLPRLPRQPPILADQRRPHGVGSIPHRLASRLTDPQPPSAPVRYLRRAVHDIPRRFTFTSPSTRRSLPYIPSRSGHPRSARPPPFTRNTMNRKPKRMLIGAGLAAVLAILFLAIRDSGSAPAAPVESDLAIAEVRDLNIRAEASGTIEPILVVEVKSKASGEILQLHAATGDN